MSARHFLSFLAMVVMAFTCPSQVHSAQLDLPIATSAVASVEGQPGLAVRFEGLAKLKGTKVLYAKCVLSLEVDSCEGMRPEILVRPVRQSVEFSDQSGTVTYDSTSVKQGNSHATVIDVQIEKDGLAELLLTQVIQQVADSGLMDLTVILTPISESTACRLTLLHTATSVGQSGGKLIVKYANRK